MGTEVWSFISTHTQREREREREQRESSKSPSYWAIKLELGTPALHQTTTDAVNKKGSEGLAGRKRKRKEEENEGWVRGSERMCVLVCGCVCDGKRESKRSDSLAREQIQEPLSHYKAQA